jgi:5-aminolevulinate synthase
MGGYIAANNQIIDAIRLSSPGFIFTTSLPPLIAEAAKASICYLKQSELERTKHQMVVFKVKKAFERARLHYLPNESHIIPIIIGNAFKAKEASDMLFNKYNIYIQHINFPTVPKGTERLRIIPTPAHTDKMIEDLVNALIDVFRILNIGN